MMHFPAHFREHVVPKLRHDIAVQAFRLATDQTDYGGAYAEVFAVARHYGALRLPDWALTDLRDWISTELLAAIMAAERRIDALQAEIEAERASDPVGHYARLAQSCMPGMQWIFAAISPEYRAHLIAEHRRG